MRLAMLMDNVSVLYFSLESDPRFLADSRAVREFFVPRKQEQRAKAV